jgi:hypothetical protein
MSTPLRRYFRGSTLSGMHDVQANQMRYYHFDHQGTTQALTDSTGAVTDRFASDAWGVQVRRTGSSINRQWYIGNWGYYRQKDVGTDYLRGRYYIGSAAVMASPDAWALYGTLYGYCGGMPTGHVDPSGWVKVLPVCPKLWSLPDEAGPTTSCCGDRWAHYKYQLDRQYQEPGWIVQKVKFTGKRESCSNPPMDTEDYSKSKPLYEAWYFPARGIDWEHAGRRSIIDSTYFAATNESQGTEGVDVEIRFYLLSQIDAQERPDRWPRGGCPEALGGFSPDFPCTTKEPGFWKSVSPTERGRRSANSEWNCCTPGCNMPDKRYTRATSTPSLTGVSKNCVDNATYIKIMDALKRGKCEI